MAKQFAKLLRIDSNEEIKEKTHYEFLYHLQKSLLLALRERGKLTAMQHRYAEEGLREQRRERARRMMGKGES